MTLFDDVCKWCRAHGMECVSMPDSEIQIFKKDNFRVKVER